MNIDKLMKKSFFVKHEDMGNQKDRDFFASKFGSNKKMQSLSLQKSFTQSSYQRPNIDYLKNSPKSKFLFFKFFIEENSVLPKQTQKEAFQVSLDSVKFDVQLRSYAKKHNGDPNGSFKTDNFQTTKLSILISSSNSTNDIHGLNNSSNMIYSKQQTNGAKQESQLQRKMGSENISDNTKKLLTKVYEIDLVPFSNQANTSSDKSMIQKNHSKSSLIKSFGTTVSSTPKTPSLSSSAFLEQLNKHE
jgi:hypothetical protein